MEGRKGKGRAVLYIGAGGMCSCLPDSLVDPQIQKLADRSDVISEVPKCSKIQIFRSAPPGEGARCLPPKNPICSFGSRFYGSQGLTKYIVGNHTNDRLDLKCRPI